jgi:hypothetical protein
MQMVGVHKKAGHQSIELCGIDPIRDSSLNVQAKEEWMKHWVIKFVGCIYGMTSLTFSFAQTPKDFAANFEYELALSVDAAKRGLFKEK